MRIVRTRHGARMEEDGLILSEILDHPGATDTLFDVLAAAVAAVARGPDTLMLGFAGGGMVAPLRAMGFAHPIEAVDLSLEGEKVFRDLSMPWCGQVDVHEADAVDWLRGSRRRYDTIIEDLSARMPDGVTKPPVSLDVLPALMHKRLRARGAVVVNVLPVPGHPWTTLLPHLAAPFDDARVIVLEQWENRVLILGSDLDDARSMSDLIRRLLVGIDSIEANGLSVRTLRR